MTEVAVSTRVDKHLAKDLEKYMELEHLEKSSAVRKLLHRSVHEWKVEYALKKLESGEFTLSKAAEFSELDIFALVARVKSVGIKWVDQEGVLRDLR